MMKKAILIPIMLLVLIPFVSAECSLWKPSTWWECIFGDNNCYDVYENESKEAITQKMIMGNVTGKFYCNNAKENCVGQYPNGSWYKTKTYFVTIGYENITIFRTKKIFIGAVKCGDDIYSYYDAYCRAINNEPVCHSCGGDGLCHLGLECNKEDGRVCWKPRKNVFYNSGHYKSALSIKEINITKHKLDK